MKSDLLPQGAELLSNGVRYRVWAPASGKVEVEIIGVDSGPERVLPLALDASGYFHGTDSHGRAGDEYRYRLDGGRPLPDPASRWQRRGVHGPSVVIDPADYRWNDREWRIPAMQDLAIYELHVGAFTPEGTFLAAIEKLRFLRELGVTAIELMPVADFPGERNWGYDGVCLYAPSRAYGHPHDLRALVDAAHREGLAVMLDVVYNHFGPDGNYLGAFTPHYFNPEHHTPWGAALNFDGEFSGPVRAFFLANIAYWMEEFHIDGFRLDATHSIIDESPWHILSQIADTVHQRGGFVVAEDPRNEARLVASPHEDGFGLDGLWADDFHHVVRVTFTGEQEGYYGDYRGGMDELIDLLRHGWLYRGQISPGTNAERGTECSHLPPHKFVHCISNHDQIGNQAFGERLGHLISPAQYRAASALLLLGPYIPMLFMGQEWDASSSFAFFTDHHEELGRLITTGRRKEFATFTAFRDPKIRETIPDPQALATFEHSKLDWNEPERPPYAQILALYRALLALRRGTPALRPEHRDHWQVGKIGGAIGGLRSESGDQTYLVLFDLTGNHSAALKGEPLFSLPEGHKWTPVLSTDETRFGGHGRSVFDSANGRISIQDPQVIVLSKISK